MPATIGTTSGVLLLGQPWRPSLPLPDGTISAADRQRLAGSGPIPAQPGSVFVWRTTLPPEAELLAMRGQLALAELRTPKGSDYYVIQWGREGDFGAADTTSIIRWLPIP